jgi:hypothetical protein
MLEVIGRTGKSRLLGTMGKQGLLFVGDKKPIVNTQIPQVLFGINTEDIRVINYIYKTTRRNDMIIFYVNNNKQLLNKAKEIAKLIDPDRFVILMHD